MKMEQATLIQYSPTGTDILGNKTTERTEYKDIKVRVTQWTAEDVAILGREVTANMRKLLTQAKLDDMEACSHINIDSIDYYIDKVLELGRWRLAYISSYDKTPRVSSEY